jgi:hypothetical protein
MNEDVMKMNSNRNFDDGGRGQASFPKVPWSCGVLLFFILAAVNSGGKPRPALPPLPERCLLSLRFNETNWWGDLHPPPLVFDNIQLVESWSGYALRAGAKQASRLQYPTAAIDEKTGQARTNLNLAIGSLRFWFSPDWTSASLGGTGPGVFGRLVEAGAWTQDANYGWWSLAFSDDGDTLYFSGQAAGQEADYLKTPIQFQTGVWHLITLTFGPKLSQLYIDGELVAKGEGVTLWPDAKVQAAHGFGIGNDISGQASAGGAFEEFTTFGYALSAEEIAHYYSNTRPLADLGAITPEEEQAQLAYLTALRQLATRRTGSESMLTDSPPPPPVEGGGEGATNGPGYSGSAYQGPLLHLQVPVWQGTNVLLTIAGGDSDARYDLFSTTNLLSPASNTVWQLETSGTNRQTLVLSGLSVPIGIYQLGTQLDTDYDGLTDAYESLVNKSNPNVWDLPPNGDWDHDNTLNYWDARSTDASVTNALRIRILKPANGAVIR